MAIGCRCFGEDSSAGRRCFTDIKIVAIARSITGNEGNAIAEGHTGSEGYTGSKDFAGDETCADTSENKDALV